MIIVEVSEAVAMKYKVRSYLNMKVHLQILISILSPKVKSTIILMILKTRDILIKVEKHLNHQIDGEIILKNPEGKGLKFLEVCRNNLDHP